ncbi:MAG: head GIN domain-containing protein [Pseudomonadota bacterium]
MRTLLKIGSGLMLLAFVLIGISYSALRSKAAHGITAPGSHMLTRQTRPINGEVVTVELSGPLDMTLRQGATASLTVHGEERLLPNVATTQDGKTLRIGTTGIMLMHRQPLKVDLVLPSIEHLIIRGSGDSTINGFSGEKLDMQLLGSGNVVFNGRFRQIAAGVRGSGDLELNGGNSDKVNVELAGSGQMTVVGSCKEFKAQQSGTGELDAKHMTAEKVSVDVHGSGNSNVQAKHSAAVTLRGSGDITVYGNPNERDVNRTGSGEVTWKN